MTSRVNLLPVDRLLPVDGSTKCCQKREGSAHPACGRDGAPAASSEGCRMPAEETYEIHAVKYGHHAERQASANFMDGDPHEGPMPILRIK
jgi:hypothetical protein